MPVPKAVIFTVDMLQLWVNFATLMVPCFRYTNDNNVRWHARGFQLRNILLVREHLHETRSELRPVWDFTSG